MFLSCDYIVVSVWFCAHRSRIDVVLYRCIIIINLFNLTCIFKKHLKLHYNSESTTTFTWVSHFICTSHCSFLVSKLWFKWLLLSCLPTTVGHGKVHLKLNGQLKPTPSLLLRVVLIVINAFHSTIKRILSSQPGREATEKLRVRRINFRLAQIKPRNGTGYPLHAKLNINFR